MKNLLVCSLVVLALTGLAGCNAVSNLGGSQQVSHTESDKGGWFGGQYHEANTVYKNSDGSTSVETETTSVSGNTTTVVREKKTTAVDGTVNSQKETRVIVKGSDSSIKETKTSK